MPLRAPATSCRPWASSPWLDTRLTKAPAASRCRGFVVVGAPSRPLCSEWCANRGQSLPHRSAAVVDRSNGEHRTFDEVPRFGPQPAFPPVDSVHPVRRFDPVHRLSVFDPVHRQRRIHPVDRLGGIVRLGDLLGVLRQPRFGAVGPVEVVAVVLDGQPPGPGVETDAAGGSRRRARSPGRPGLPLPDLRSTRPRIPG